MPKITRAPTAEELYSQRGKIARATLAAALAEARELGTWAGRRISNGPTSGALTQGYNICGTGDLDLAIAMIVARVRDDTTTKMLTRGSVSHVARIKPGVFVAGTIRNMDSEYATPSPGRARANRRRAQLAVRKTGHCDNCGADFVSSEPGMRAGPAKRTRAQWRGAFRSVAESAKLAGAKVRTMLCFPGDPDLELKPSGRGEAALYGREFVNAPVGNAYAKPPTPAQARARKARGTEGVPIMFPGDHNLAGFGAESRPRKEKIPNHKGSPTGKHRGPSKGKRR